MTRHVQNGADSCACGNVWPCEDRARPRGEPIDLKPGDLCYRVVLYVMPEGRPDEWRVESRAVKHASSKRVTFDGPGYKFGTTRQHFEPTALGRFFHRTARGAIESFIEGHVEEIASLQRRQEAAAAALKWAYAALEKEPTP